MIAILWGFFHRCGGGLITCPGNKYIFRGLAPALLIYSLHPYQGWWNIAYVFALSIAFWLGNAIMGYSNHWNMENKKDWIYMTFRGLLFTVFAGIILCFLNLWAGIILALSGLVMGVAYWIGKKWPNKGAGMMQGPECSEFVFGLLIGLINII